MFLLSSLKKADTIFLGLPEKVNGKNPSILCKESIFTVKSSLQVMKNRESVVHSMPVISSEWRFPYFLYKMRGDRVLWSTAGVSNILSLLPHATAKKLESGENFKAVTTSRKLKCAKMTFFYQLTMSAYPSTSTVMRIFLFGDIATISTLLLF